MKYKKSGKFYNVNTLHQRYFRWKFLNRTKNEGWGSCDVNDGNWIEAELKLNELGFSWMCNG